MIFFLLVFPQLGKPGMVERIYYVGLCAVVVTEELAPLIAFSGTTHGSLRKFEFLPLMGVSVGCALGVVWGWMRFLRVMITE